MQYRLTRVARLALFAGFALVAAPGHAAADFLVEPFLAWARNPPDASGENARWHLGGGVGVDWTTGPLIAGADVGYASGFFDPPENALDLIQTSYVLTVSGHVGVTSPAARERRLFPYATVGVGKLRQQARDRAGLIDVTRNDWALDFGGGARVMFAEPLGIRADIRYYRDLQKPFETPSDLVQGLDALAFWRLSVGVVLRFNY